MNKKTKLPFKVGDLAEARSFQGGYRGAWFRCKIRDTAKRKGHIGHVLEYYDFPDEELEWTRLYQVPHYYVGKAKEKHRELMLRPRYPTIYNETQMPDVSKISEVTVIVDNSWKVGDLVDWLTTGCYWSGKIAQLLGGDKAQIELKPPPLGEGSSYEVHLKDIRPSLDWSPESGWTVPSQVADTGRYCARIIKPINQVIDGHRHMDTQNAGQEPEAGQVIAGPSGGLSFSSPVTSNSLAVSDEVKSMGTEKMKNQLVGTTFSKEEKDIQEKSASLGCGDSSTRKTRRPDTDSAQTTAEITTEAAEEDLNSSSPLQKHGATRGVTLSSMRLDTLEAAILDLEECANKVKWLKVMLQYGISSSDAPRPRWEFVDPQAPREIPK